MYRTIRVVFQFFFLGAFSLVSFSQGHEIKVKVEGYTQKSLILAYQLGNKTYVQDTAVADNAGVFVFNGKEPLKPGMYIIAEPPAKELLTILCDERNQRFAVKTTFKEPVKNAVFTGSVENKDFNSYVQFIVNQRSKATDLNSKKEDPAANAVDIAAIDKKLNELDLAVNQYQKNFISKHPGSFTSLIIKANTDPVPPVFSGTADEKNRQLLYWTRAHLFDNINLAEEKLLRTPFFASKVDYYIDKLTVQQPDSIIQAIDRVISLARASKPNLQFFLTDLLNKYAKSTIIGMDAVYVHIALTYYDKGMADWIQQENLDKILTNARALEPTLIGKIAPDFGLSDANNQLIRLYDFKAPLTILFFWSHESDGCRKTAGSVLRVADRFKDKGVRVLTINCADLPAGIEAGKAFITQNKLESLTNLSGTLKIGSIKSQYNIRKTPQLFVLGKNKKILFKNLSGEQLEEQINYFVNLNE